ncbi:MAG: transposase, partial [Candidatus Magnetoglobus multicellularis str. Araruama]
MVPSSSGVEYKIKHQTTMGYIYHKCATTTARTRKEIQNSKESLIKLANRYNINPKTVEKWRNRDTVEDAPMGAKRVTTVLTELEEKIICVFRKTTHLPLDDIFISLKSIIPKLSRSNLHRCLKRHGLNRLPTPETNKKEKQKFKEYPLGYLHIDITEVRLQKKKYYIFVAIDRVTKYAYTEIHENMKVSKSVSFLKNTINAFPYKIHRILTDNGIQFTYRLLKNKTDKIHKFDELCHKKNIIHKLTKFKHPWTNGQVEILNKTIKDNTVKKYTLRF